ncbi:MFS transporter [Nocardia wallacei]|uniref:MFS transporter n=1 Tax=Nocardia wallacei TaxID=480035 RepID=UPI0024564634|nr:MFS transporter [Nocardia wallacei]
MERRPGGVARLGVLVAVIAAVAVNLRPGITTVGPRLDDITAYYGAGARAAGVITAVPVVAFAVVSLVVPLVRGRMTLRGGMFGALAVIGVSLAVRPWGDLWLFVAATFTAALGVGLLTVLLPAAVRAIGNTRVLVATFTTGLQAGAALGFAAVVPLSDLLGGWRPALAIWAVLAPIAIAALWWSPATAAAEGSPSTTTHSPAAPHPAAATDPNRSRPAGTANPLTILRRTGTTGLAVFFGLQALVAFVVMGWLPSVLRDAGVGASAAGGYLGLLTFLGVPISLTVPPIVARSAHPERWLAGFSGCTVLGVLAFLVAPAAAPLLWSLVLGTGLAVFSLALTVITVRAGSAEQAVEVSGAVQGVGYLIAAVGPYGIGLFRQLGDGWALPLGVLLATAVAQALTALTAGAAPRAPVAGQSAHDNGRHDG